MEGVKTIISLLGDLATFFWVTLRPQNALAAENLFLRKQLAMYQERKAKPRRPDTPIRITLVLLSRLFNWRDALLIVPSQTLIRWRRQGFRLFWRWKARPGRPPISVELRQLIREMAMNTPFWDEERIANELLLKPGIRVSPRTARKNMPESHPGRPHGDQRRATFVPNHASTILACDFCVVVTTTFRLLYVFIVIEHKTRRIVHCNVTTIPTPAWTLQQLREAILSDHLDRFLIHDRDGMLSPRLDQSISLKGIRVL
jgi:putative transposase